MPDAYVNNSSRAKIPRQLDPSDFEKHKCDVMKLTGAPGSGCDEEVLDSRHGQIEPRYPGTGAEGFVGPDRNSCWVIDTIGRNGRQQ